MTDWDSFVGWATGRDILFGGYFCSTCDLTSLLPVVMLCSFMCPSDESFDGATVDDTSDSSEFGGSGASGCDCSLGNDVTCFSSFTANVTESTTNGSITLAPGKFDAADVG